MLYNDLTPEQKVILAAWERETRAWVNHTISVGIVQARALQASLNATDGAGDILASLDAGQIVPNSSGLQGAHDLSKEEWATLTTAGLDDFLVAYDTLAVRQLAAKVAGPTAGLK